MFCAIVGVHWFLLDKISESEYTEELGGLVGCFGIIIIAIIHVALFGVMGWNWVDIFHAQQNLSWLHISL